MQHWTYWLTESKNDPVNSGDSVSWFRFYKTGNGVTHVPVIDKVAVGDVIWFYLNHHCFGGAKVLQVHYNICTNQNEAYFDSNKFEPSGEVPSWAIPEASTWGN